MSSIVAPQAVDGRVARGERTRQALAEAMIVLIEEGDPLPTARRVAERAGVSLRLVFHHFDDLESILRAAVGIQEERHWRNIRPAAPTLPVHERVARVVHQRAVVFRAVAPVRRSAELLRHTSPTVAAELGRAGEWLRAQLRTTFAPELEDRRPAQARLLLDALEVATSWSTWDQLERLGRSPASCRRTMETLATAVLSGPLDGGRP
ncbi:MAG TPA: TetR/AcrR family transcriptional regulator [Acidimicrobiales bacterium]|nr:TetR/AcrR family transcriptional regulator [Acidimicrobiales bacterium]HLN41069.1 TetR/AcrR family transcriptional regulator [Acidimicrobiales bacterium]